MKSLILVITLTSMSILSSGCSTFMFTRELSASIDDKRSPATEFCFPDGNDRVSQHLGMVHLVVVRGRVVRGGSGGSGSEPVNLLFINKLS